MHRFSIRSCSLAPMKSGMSVFFLTLLGGMVADRVAAQVPPVLPAPLSESASQHFHTLPPEARSFFDQQDQLSRLQAQRERLGLESDVLRLQMDYKLLQRQLQEERNLEVLTVMHWDGQPSALLVDDQSRFYMVRVGTQVPKIGRVERIEAQGVSLRDAERPKAAPRVLGFRGGAPAVSGRPASVNGQGAARSAASSIPVSGPRPGP